MTVTENKDVPEIEQPVKETQEVAPPENDDNDPQKPIYNKIQMRDAVKRERDRAYEKAKREALMELQQQQQQQAPQDQQQPVATQAAASIMPPQTQSLGGIQQISPEQIKQLIAQEAPKALEQHARAFQQQQLVNSFVSKMQAAEAKYPGLDQKLNELDYSNPATIELIKHADRMENTGDIMNELIENPMKMGNLISLMMSGQNKLAEKAIQNLSSSIKMNDQALAQEKASNDPFSQQKPSLNAGKDDGNMSVSDFKSMFKKEKWK